MLTEKKILKVLNRDEIIDAVERSMVSLENPGFCVECGAEASGVEPDAERYSCESCGESGVYGAEQLLIYVVI